MTKSYFDLTSAFILIRKDDTLSRLTSKEVKCVFTDQEVFVLQQEGWIEIAYIEGKFGFAIREGLIE